MKVTAFNCSSRADGNTAILLKTALAEMAKLGIETELVQLAGKPIVGCIACYRCFERKDCKCAITADNLNEYLQKMNESDGILIGSPVYFGDCTATARALIERVGFVSRANGDFLKRKAGAAVVAVRRAGGIHAFNSINLFFTISQMMVVGSSYWNIGVGREAGQVNDDEEGIATMQTLGKNMAWLLDRISD